LTPADGSDPRTFPAIWNVTADTIEAQGSAVLPSGGTAGQVLVKDSGTDYDVSWSTGAAGPTGPQGVAGPAGLGAGIPPQSSYYIRVASSNSNLTAVLDRAYYSPIWVFETGSFDRIATRTGATFSGSGVLRMGIYNDNGGVPGTLVLDAGTVAPNAANTNYEITIDQSLSAGLYWLCAVSQTNAATNQYQSFLTPNAQTNVGTTPDGNNQVIGWSENDVSGALTTAGILATSTNNVKVVLRKA
jgi:hypothetical protein